MIFPPQHHLSDKRDLHLMMPVDGVVVWLDPTPQPRLTTVLQHSRLSILSYLADQFPSVRGERQPG
ncbi:hypothetical protein E2C01_030822 [Portunus trituberculatus]|uniref:Uncharacterized protein n=1 Tax=Portunus trituberculatus TaxID=210409 RepID=A0A5B7EWC4_PORTR|nr:hypothetical protein [Portunus trituberculatus]